MYKTLNEGIKNDYTISMAHVNRALVKFVVYRLLRIKTFLSCCPVRCPISYVN